MTNIKSRAACQQLDELFTRKQAAEYLGRTEHTLKVWERRGIGPRCVRVPGTYLVRYRASDLAAWLEQCTTTPQNEVSDDE